MPITAQIANAIIGFSKTDACDYAADSIRVNCIAAGEVMLTKTRPELAGGVPLPRKGEEMDVANAALWLSLPGSGWLTGLVVPVDGGRGLHHWW
jgi:NAD(P)-dependent dehydrogenase (short-subunit alcohol dehydrogenase family)